MDKNILNIDQVFIDITVNSQEEAFEFISQKALELKIISSKDALIAGFKTRESEGTTGFEDGFAIPHARIDEVLKPACIVVKLSKGIEWQSLDGKPAKYLFALIVPSGQGDEHMTILSNIATMLLNQEFVKIIKTATKAEDVINAFKIEKTNLADIKVANKNGLKIVAISACTVGIAHTYMAEEKLIKEGAKMGHQVRVETHGSKGIGTPLTSTEISEADVVIFATDISVDDSRFQGKKLYKVKVAKAIKDTKKVIESAINDGTIVSKSENKDFNMKDKKGSDRQGVLQHILAGISYMIPIIVLGGICLAFSLGIAKAIWGPTGAPDGSYQLKGPDGNYQWDEKGNAILHAATSPWGPLNILNYIGGAAFGLMIPILAGFIGNSIAGRAAIAPAMVGAFIGNTNTQLMPWIGHMDTVPVPLGFIGAIIAGLLVGYLVKWINTWNVPRSIAPAMPIFFIPLVAGIGISLIFMYIIGAPIGWVMNEIQIGIKNAYGDGKIGFALGLGLGIVLGAMAGFDMGGPINKIAFITGSMLITMGINQPMGAVAAAIPVAPLGMGFTTVFFKKFFNKDERGLGLAAIIMGCIGISEGAIPFAIRDPKRAIACNVLGSAVAGGIAGSFQVTDAAAHGGPIVAVLGAVPYGPETAYFFIAITAGVVVNTLIYGFWLTKDAGAPGSVKEAHVSYLAELLAFKKEAIESAKESKQDKNVIKEEISKIKEEYNRKKAESKSAYKTITPDENKFIKTKKIEIKDFKINNKKDFISEMTQIKSQNLKGDALADKKENIKDQTANNYYKFQENLRNDFVSQYKSKLS